MESCTDRLWYIYIAVGCGVSGYKGKISDMKWLAYYKTNNLYNNYMLPDGSWVCWQCIGIGSVKRINGNVDMNAWYRY